VPDVDLQVLQVRQRAGDAEGVRLLSLTGVQHRRRGRPRGAEDAASRIGRVGFAAGARRSTVCEDGDANRGATQFGGE
jgi:hypothetical protein